MSNYPTEILGFSITDNSLTAQTHRQNRICPFTDNRCCKKSGVCSVQYSNQIIAICPDRFRQNQTVMKQIAQDHFGTLNDILVFAEIPSGNSSLGTFDYVMAKHKPLSAQVEDFVIIEFQTVDTTNTGRLNDAVIEFASGLNVQEKNYGFGLNWANVWKRCFIQILNKGRVLEKWGHKAYWVVQEPSYDYFLRAYGLADAMIGDSNNATVFEILDLTRSENKSHLIHKRFDSTKIQDLLYAFGNNPNIPSKELFIGNLVQKIRKNAFIQFDFTS